MIEFSYKARDATGVSRMGTVQASSRSIAASQLRSRGMIVLGIDAVQQDSAARFQFDIGQWLKPRSIDVELSLQQLAMMLRGGMTLLSALKMTIEQSSRKSLSNIWRKVVDDIQSGESLSAAIKKHPCFPEFVVQLVHVGERTGELPPVMERAVRTMRSRRKGVQEITSALIYPLMVILIAIGVTVYMVVYLIPRLEVYLQSLGKSMPAMTQNLVNASIWVRESYAIIIIIVSAISVFSLVAYRSNGGRLWVDQYALRVPLIGRLFRLCETSTFARSLSIMLGSGITLIDGLGTVEKLLYNRFTARTVNIARDRIIQGGNFSDAIDSGNAFSPMLKKMVAVGQQSGDLRGVLQEVADFHEDQFRAAIRRMNAIVTPALTIGVGAIVGYVYIAFFVALLAAGN